MIYNVFIVILVKIYHCYIMYNIKKYRIARLYGPECPYWFTPCIGEASKERRCEPPICYAVLFFLPVSIKHLMKKPMGVGLVPTPPVFLYQIPSSTSENMRTCFTEGGSVLHARNLSDPRPFTTRKYSIYKYFRQYYVEYSSI